jgi:hypothetical protein
MVALLALAGCAQPPKKQAYDVELSSRIHTVLLAQVPNQQSFTTTRNWWFIPPGNLGAPFVVAAVADTLISTERVTAALDAKQTRLQDRFSEMLRDGLNAQGYETRTVVLPAADEPDKLLPLLRQYGPADAALGPDKLLPLLRQYGPADAALVVMLKGYVSWTEAPAKPAQDQPRADFFPLLDVTARAFDLGSGAILYEDRFVYGRADQQAGAMHFPIDPKYGFAGVGDVVADPARLREGWIAGMRMIADKILTDLKRKPSED